MARDHAQIHLRVWEDDDWRALSSNAQHLYWTLLAHPGMSYCGVVDWRPAKLSGFVGDWTVDIVEAAARELMERLYIVVDETTEEVLVRSYVRHDGLMKQPKMATAMATAHAAVGSVALRQIVVWELQRLKREEPDLKGWGSEKASALLDKPSLDASTFPCGKGPGNPSSNPTVKGSGHPSPKKPKGSGKPPENPPASPCSLLLAPNSTSAPNGAGRPSRPTTSSKDEPLPEETTAQDVLGWWIDQHRQRPPGRLIGQVGKMIKELLGEGFDAEAVKGGLFTMSSKSLNPSTLPSLVNEVANKPRLRAVATTGPGIKPWE